jgi:hypothetical protein
MDTIHAADPPGRMTSVTLIAGPASKSSISSQEEGAFSQLDLFGNTDCKLEGGLLEAM